MADRTNEVPGGAGYDPTKFEKGSKVCPLLKIYCLKTGCAWWVMSVSRCAVKYMIAGKSSELNRKEESKQIAAVR